MQLSDFHWSDIITKLVAAVVILVVTAIISKLVKKFLTAQLSKIKIFQRQAGSGDNLAASLGQVVSLLVWLFGLMAVMNLFQLTSVMSPLQGMLDTFLAALPKIVGAGLVFFVGFVFAKIARELTVTALQAVGADRLGEKLGGAAKKADQVTGTSHAGGLGENWEKGDAQTQAVAARPQGGLQISTLAGQLVFAVILIVVSISALQMLGIKAISDPATQMLGMILNALPLILGAAILLAIGGVIAKFAGDLLESLLRGLNIDATLAKAGIDTSKTDLPKVLARIAQVAIVLFFAVAATNMLGFPQITEMLNTVLALGGRVIFGAAIIVVGVFLASLLAGLANGRAAQIIRAATIVLFAAMGLKYMGLADSIINMAFAALVIGGAAAAALAFGLGGREAAARQLDKLQKDAERTPSV